MSRVMGGKERIVTIEQQMVLVINALGRVSSLDGSMVNSRVLAQSMNGLTNLPTFTAGK
jgi:hypothetical protein